MVPPRRVDLFVTGENSQCTIRAHYLEWMRSCTSGLMCSPPWTWFPWHCSGCGRIVSLIWISPYWPPMHCQTKTSSLDSGTLYQRSCDLSSPIKGGSLSWIFLLQLAGHHPWHLHGFISWMSYLRALRLRWTCLIYKLLLVEGWWSVIEISLSGNTGVSISHSEASKQM